MCEVEKAGGVFVKKIVGLFLSIILIFTFCSLTVLASTVQEDGIEVEITTDKEEYEEGESISVTISATNQNDSNVKDVKIESTTPNGFKLADGASSSISKESLGSGETLTLKTTYEAEKSTSGNENPPIGGGDSSNTGLTNSTVSNQANQNEIAMQTSDKESPNTGDTNYFGIVFVAFLISVTAIVVVSVKMKKAKRILSLILCIAIAGSVLPNLQMYALEGNEEDLEYSYINLSKYITVDGKPVLLPVVVSYALDNATDDDGEFEEIPEGSYTPKEENIVYTNKEKTYGYVNNMVFIFFNENLPEAERRAICESIDGKIICYNKSLDLYDVEIPPRDKKGLQELCKQLEDMDGVITATYDIVGDTIAAVSSIPNDTWKDEVNGINGVTWDENNPDGLNWWLEATYVPSAWNYSQYFHHMKIGVADRGFDTGHEDLNITVLNESENTIDDHGTHVAGIIGATPNNGRGITGITRNADLLGYDVFPGSSIYTNLKEEMNGIDKLLEQGAKVINFSIYSKNNGLTQDKIYERGYEQAKYIAQFLHKFGPNFIIVTIAGNGNENDIGIDTKNANGFAGINDNIIDRVQQAYDDEFGTGEYFSKDEFYDSFMIVGAVDKEKTSDGEYQLTTFSNYGNAVTVCAPGQDVFSTIVTGGEDGSYGNRPGTSMAAPIVSGITSMVWAVNPDFTPSVVKDIVTSTATTKVIPRNSGDPRATYPMVNAKAAVEKAIQVSDDYNPNSDYGTIYGQVCEAETGNPLEATIEIYSSDELYQTITSSAETGDFSVSLPAGTYELKFSKDWYKVEKYFDEYTVTVPLEKGGLYILSDPIEMTKMLPTFTGRVIDAKTEKQLEGVIVSLKGIDKDDQDVTIVASQTQEDGTFNLTVPKDNMADITALRFTKDGYDEYIFPITPNSSENVDIGTVALNSAYRSSISGKVIDRDTQKPIEKVEISLAGIGENNDEVTISTSTTATDGTFNLSVPKDNTATITGIKFKKDGYCDYLYPLENLSSESFDIGTIPLIPIWDGSVATSFAGGSGTKDDPYLISNGAELAYLSHLARNVSYSTYYQYYLLTQDIYLNDTSTFENWEAASPANSWTPIGFLEDRDYYAYRFGGNFDGGGHTVYGAYVDLGNSASVGLFGLCDGATISNLSLKDSYIIGKQYVGGISGSSKGESLFYNCSNQAVIRGERMVGGIVGCDDDGVFRYCCNVGNITATDGSAGGIVGSSNGEAANFTTGTLQYCYNTGNITGAFSVGGIAGCASYFTNCYNAGIITVTDRTAGGITGTLTAIGKDKHNYVVNCYNAGEIRCSNESLNLEDKKIGGLIGNREVRTTLETSYFLDTTAEYDFGIGGWYTARKDCALTDEQMRSSENFTGFNFTDIWYINENSGYPYPQLFFPE